MNKLELRRIALSTARSLLRERGINPVTADDFTVEAFLDDFSRSHPDTLAASYWVEYEGDMREWRSFKREWKKWQKDQRILE